MVPQAVHEPPRCFYTLNNSAPRAVDLAGIATVAELLQRIGDGHFPSHGTKVMVGHVEYGNTIFDQLVALARNNNRLVINIFTRKSTIV